jgi:UDP-N-acetylglucosamine/UDP-N-acetylgalactosamine diphosphorylase
MDDILSLCRNPQAIEHLRAHRRRVAALLDRGVRIPCPETIEIAPDVDLERIDPSVTLHAGTRLAGARTALGPGVELGREGPVALEDSVLGPNVVIDGGFFQGVTFLDGASARSWAHMREGTLLEEQASVAHCVGLKQTILFPYVTLGSLINFCDCLMAGGTSRKDHSEVGSGYIHFNFTPRGDKATPSLFGDVPRGVLLDQPRIFLGGLAASVGPMQVGYGSFLGPGSVYRRDVRDGRFQLAEKQIQMQLEFDPMVLTGIGSKLQKNFNYIGNLAALWHWYAHVRPLFAGGGRALFYREAQATVAAALTERIGQLEKLVALIPESIRRLEAQGAAERTLEDQRRLRARWPAVREALEAWPTEYEEAARDRLKQAIAPRAAAGRYLEVIPSLPAEAREAAILWLRSIVSGVHQSADRALKG